MDREKFSAIAHRGHTHCNPISTAKVERILDLLSLRSGDRVVDFGCGKAELAMRLIERFGVTVDAVDRSARMIAEAKRRAAGRVDPSKLIIHARDASDFGEAQHYALAICVGSSHAFGDYISALRHLIKVTRPGGHLLMAEGCWRRKPDPEYLAALGGTEHEMTSHQQNVERAEALGLVPLHACVSSDDEWDEYEWRYARSIEEYAIENPSDPDVPAMLQRIRAWRKTYLTWGRDTLGFAMYLFRRD